MAAADPIPSHRPRSLPAHENLTVLEVATFLRVSDRMIYKHVAEGDMPSIRVGRLIRIERSAFLTWLRSAGGDAGLSGSTPVLSGHRGTY
jgi:excisionase family DNA binding protein